MGLPKILCSNAVVLGNRSMHTKDHCFGLAGKLHITNWSHFSFNVRFRHVHNLSHVPSAIHVNYTPMKFLIPYSPKSNSFPTDWDEMGNLFLLSWKTNPSVQNRRTNTAWEQDQSTSLQRSSGLQFQFAGSNASPFFQRIEPMARPEFLGSPEAQNPPCEEAEQERPGRGVRSGRVRRSVCTGTSGWCSERSLQVSHPASMTLGRRKEKRALAASNDTCAMANFIPPRHISRPMVEPSAPPNTSLA